MSTLTKRWNFYYYLFIRDRIRRTLRVPSLYLLFLCSRSSPLVSRGTYNSNDGTTHAPLKTLEHLPHSPIFRYSIHDKLERVEAGERQRGRGWSTQSRGLRRFRLDTARFLEANKRYAYFVETPSGFALPPSFPRFFRKLTAPPEEGWCFAKYRSSKERPRTNKNSRANPKGSKWELQEQHITFFSSLFQTRVHFEEISSTFRICILILILNTLLISKIIKITYN